MRKSGQVGDLVELGKAAAENLTSFLMIKRLKTLHFFINTVNALHQKYTVASLRVSLTLLWYKYKYTYGPGNFPV